MLKNDELTDKIMRVTGRFPVACDCDHCRMQCMTPCLGTPQDIWRLIENGYEDRLRLTLWYVGVLAGRISFPILMVQPHQTRQGCVFWKDGVCELHNTGLKPTEGRLSHHVITEENFCFEKSLSWNVAREWINIENILLIKKIVTRITLSQRL